MDKPLVWLRTEVKTPPFSEAARIGAGVALRRLQRGERLGMPVSRAMPGVGSRVHELRIRDGSGGVFWRIVYRVDDEAIVIAAVFKKKTTKTPQREIELSQQRLQFYDELLEE